MLRPDHSFTQILYVAWQLSTLITHLGFQFLTQDILFYFYMQVNTIMVFGNFNYAVVPVWYTNYVRSMTDIQNKCTFPHQTQYYTWYRLFKSFGFVHLWKSEFTLCILVWIRSVLFEHIVLKILPEWFFRFKLASHTERIKSWARVLRYECWLSNRPALWPWEYDSTKLCLFLHLLHGAIK